MNNLVFGYIMKNVRKHRNIKHVTREKRINYLVSKPSYYSTKLSTKNLLAKEIRKTQILMNKPVYLGLSILQLSKVVMYEFQFDYVKPKYVEKAKLCYMDADSFIVYMKTDDIYKEITVDVEARFYTSNYVLDRSLPKVKNKKLNEGQIRWKKYERIHRIKSNNL